MAQYYSVVQFVPNPLTDERVNIGVIVFDDSGQRDSRFLENWSRVSSFGGHAPALQAVAREIAEAALTPGSVEEMSARWRHSVQLTAPRASLAPMNRLLDDMSETMLVQRPKRSPNQAKLQVVRAARTSFERAFANLGRDQDISVDPRGDVVGLHATHEVDLTVSNGHLLLAAKAVSFARKPGRDIERDISATAWTIEDLRQGAQNFTVAVLVAPPDDTKRADFREGARLFRDLQAEVLSADDLESFAETFAQTV